MTQYYTGVKADHPKYEQDDLRPTLGLRATFNFLPKTLDNYTVLRPYVKDQGEEGSCVSFASTESISFAVAMAVSNKLFLKSKHPSPYWLNFSERWLMMEAQKIDPWEETSPTGEDGTDIRSVLKVASKGLVLSKTLPYVAGKRVVSIDIQKQLAIKADCDKYRVLNYWNCFHSDTSRLIKNIKQSIMRSGSVIFAATLADNFMDIGSSGIVPPANQALEGLHSAHAMVLAGWTEDSFVGINSWGKNWGDKGLFYWPIEEFVKHCFAAWAVGSVIAPSINPA